MPACIPPTTRSPGHLVWFYLYQGKKHSFSMRLIDGVDIYTAGPLVAEAARIAADWAFAFTNLFVCDQMAIRDEGGRIVYAASIGPFTGVQTPPVGAQAWRSHTMQFVGRGNVNVPGECAGPEHTQFLVGNTINFAAGQQYLDTSAEPDIDNLRGSFNASLYGPADFYGQQVDYHGLAPIQSNSAYEKKFGE